MTCSASRRGPGRAARVGGPWAARHEQARPRGRPSWPIRSGTVPALANGFSVRLETAPGLAAALPAGAAAALVPDRAEAPAASPAQRRLPMRRTG